LFAIVVTAIAATADGPPILKTAQNRYIADDKRQKLAFTYLTYNN
jgi:hypothetical protein